MFTLIIEDRLGNIADEISFDQGSFTIGRVEGNDIILPSNAVSRTHARIFVQQGRCYIDDLGSANGVLVDNQPLKQRKELQNASQIRIGDYLLYLEHSDKNAGGDQDVLRTHIVAANSNTFKLVRVGDLFAGEEFSLTEQVNSIGRTDENFILLSDPSISRNHAQIVNEGMAYRLVDLGSSNGSKVNGKPVRGQTHLRTGDEVQFGNVRFVFVPSPQFVDLAAYGRPKRQSGSLVFVIVGVLLVAIIVGAVFAVIAVLGRSESASTDKPKVVETVDPTVELNNKFNAAVAMANEQNWTGAQRLLTDILTVQPTFPNARELHDQVSAEIQHLGYFEQGDEWLRAGNYASALTQFSKIPETSAYYARSQNKLQLVNERLATATFLEGKIACDKEPNAACVQTICEALQLNSADNNARVYLERLLLSKDVKKAKDLSAMIQGCLDALPK
ncbi:MAG: FHA domain-containing protein [Myxococcota bacterium]|jgi:pSer/pThr/pTyr-binding forkhead associated (FHA) protein|nr:FHA domain-containing protein [Myxococcota bacterium]